MTDDHRIITFEPDKGGGRPCIRGMRIAVADVSGGSPPGCRTRIFLSDLPGADGGTSGPPSPTPRIATGGSWPP
jgi:Protein of unknown function (DUF433)